MKNVFDEAILVAPEPTKEKRCLISEERTTSQNAWSQCVHCSEVALHRRWEVDSYSVFTTSILTYSGNLLILQIFSSCVISPISLSCITSLVQYSGYKE